VRLAPARSATLRLTLSVAGVVVAMALAAMALQYRATAAALAEAQAARLAADMAGLGTLYDQRRLVALTSAFELRAQTTPPAAELFVLTDRDGAVLAGNLPAWPAGVTARPDGFGVADARPFRREGADYLAVARELPGGFGLFLAHATAEKAATLARLRRGILAVAAGLVAVSLAAGWLVARRVTERIGRLNALADRVAAGDLAARLPGPRSPDEWGALETHIHAMLDRIVALNRATHRLSDTIAHELRTPLNRIRQKLGRIEGQEALAAELAGELRRTIRIFDSLLDISAAEAAGGSRPGLVPVDLSALAAEVFELYEPAAEERGLAPEAAIAPGLWVLGDRNLIAQALSNLLDNAIKFTPPGGRVALTLSARGDRQVLEVADSGPGLPAEIRAGAFDRFVRADRDRAVPGHGLGLALVQAIAARHGARIDLPPAERGLTLRLSFPRLDPPGPGPSP
jgi:signal transduction histidine kinase